MKMPGERDKLTGSAVWSERRARAQSPLETFQRGKDILRQGWARTLPAGLCLDLSEGLGEIGDQIVRFLNADRIADQAFGNAHGGAFLRA